MNLGRKLFLACQYLIILKNRAPFPLMINMNSLLNLSGDYQGEEWMSLLTLSNRGAKTNEIKKAPLALKLCRG